MKSSGRGSTWKPQQKAIQDSECLRMLKEVASAHPSDSVRVRAMELLNRTAGLVSRSLLSPSSPQWRSQRESGEADKLRIEIGEVLDMLLEPSS